MNPEFDTYNIVQNIDLNSRIISAVTLGRSGTSGTTKSYFFMKIKSF